MELGAGSWNPSPYHTPRHDTQYIMDYDVPAASDVHFYHTEAYQQRQSPLEGRPTIGSRPENPDLEAQQPLLGHRQQPSTALGNVRANRRHGLPESDNDLARQPAASRGRWSVGQVLARYIWNWLPRMLPYIVAFSILCLSVYGLCLVIGWLIHVLITGCFIVAHGWMTMIRSDPSTWHAIADFISKAGQWTKNVWDWFSGLMHKA